MAELILLGSASSSSSRQLNQCSIARTAAGAEKAETTVSIPIQKPMIEPRISGCTISVITGLLQAGVHQLAPNPKSSRLMQ